MAAGPKTRVVCAITAQSTGKYRASRPYGNSVAVPVAPIVQLQLRSSTYARFSISGGSGASNWVGFFRSSVSGAGYVKVPLTVGQTYVELSAVAGASVEFFVIASNSAGAATSAPATSAPIPLPGRWMFYGDSQTVGLGATPCKSHATAFRTIWEANFPAQIPTSVTTDGIGGEGLFEHRERYEVDSHQSNEWVHLQESGDQNRTGQTTASAYRETFISFIQHIKSVSPTGLITYETSYSFQREAEAYRNWAAYNEALISAIEELKSLENPIEVILVDTDAVIKRLVTALGYATVNQKVGETPAGYTGTSPYHYTEVGNLAIALAIFKALRYDIRALNLASVTTNTSEIGKVSPEHVSACLDACDQ